MEATTRIERAVVPEGIMRDNIEKVIKSSRWMIRIGCRKGCFTCDSRTLCQKTHAEYEKCQKNIRTL